MKERFNYDNYVEGLCSNDKGAVIFMKLSTPSYFIPVCEPNFEGNEKKYVENAIAQGWVSTRGAYVSIMEEQLQDFLNVEKVVACQSGTSSIHLSLIEAGIQPGDIVLVPTLTFIAAVNPVRYQYAHPVFIDCDESLCMDPIKLRLFCEQECVVLDGQLMYKMCDGQYHPVKAVVVVHVFGNMADMESIMDTAECFKLTVIEDATEALGTRYISGKYNGCYAGTIGNFGAFSFNGNKIITTGGGGAVTSKDSRAIKHISYLSTQAKNDAAAFIHNEIGYNYRMTNVQAAIGSAQMEELPEFIRRKKNNYKRYAELFDGFKLARMIPFRKGTESNHWFYSIQIDLAQINEPIESIAEKLKEKGIGTRGIWGLIHEQKPYLGCMAYKIKNALHYGKSILNLPCSTNLKENEIEYVVKHVKDTIEQFTI